MEAMGCGLPVVCSKIRGNTDLVENGINGFLVDNDSNAVAERILSCIKSLKSDSMLKIRVCAEETVQQFSVQTVLEDLREIYQTV